MRRIWLAILSMLLVAAVTLVAGVTARPASAGSPHFVTASATRSGDTVTVSFKEAGLGDEAQIVSKLTATAECINGGSNHPKAVNKEAVTASTITPVQNGQATGSLTLTSTLSCSPPMTIVFVDVVLTDTTNGISVKFGNL